MENARYKVLLIEDNQIEQRMFQRFVENNDLAYDCLITGSVAEARNALNSETFDIIQIKSQLKISFSLSRQSVVLGRLYNLNGRVVKTMSRNKLKSGANEIFWDINNLSSGTYFLKIDTNNFSLTKSLIIN